MATEKSYVLIGRDDVCVDFTQNELEHMEFAKNILTDLSGCWLPYSEPLDTPLVLGQELHIIRSFIRTRLRVGEAPKVRDLSIEIFDAEIMDEEKKGLGYNLIRYPALISVDSMSTWNPISTGLHREYLEFLDHYIPDLHLFIFMRCADFLGCMDLLYLLQARASYCFVHYIEDYIKTHLKDSYLTSHKEKVESFMRWCYDERPDNKNQHKFMKEFNHMKQCFPIMIKRMLNTFIRHRSIDMPREDWTKEQWAEFKARLPDFYKKLPVSETQRVRLYRTIGL